MKNYYHQRSALRKRFEKMLEYLDEDSHIWGKFNFLIGIVAENGTHAYIEAEMTQDEKGLLLVDTIIRQMVGDNSNDMEKVIKYLQLVNNFRTETNRKYTLQ